MIHVEFENIPHKVVELSTKGIDICEKIKADFKNDTVKAVLSYLPEGTAVDATIVGVLEMAILSLTALKNIGDDEGFNGRFLTFSASLAHLETGGTHAWGVLIQWVQAVYNKYKAGKN